MSTTQLNLAFKGRSCGSRNVFSLDYFLKDLQQNKTITCIDLHELILIISRGNISRAVETP